MGAYSCVGREVNKSSGNGDHGGTNIALMLAVQFVNVFVKVGYGAESEVLEL